MFWGLNPYICGMKQLPKFCFYIWRCRVDDIIQHRPTFRMHSGHYCNLTLKKATRCRNLQNWQKVRHISSSTRVRGKDTCHGFTGYIYTLQGLFFEVFVVVSTDWGACLPECIPVYTLVLHLQFIFDTMQRWHKEIIFCLQGITYFTRMLCNKSRPAMQQWEALNAKYIMKEKGEVEEENGRLPQDGVKLKMKCSFKSDKITSRKTLAKR